MFRIPQSQGSEQSFLMCSLFSGMHFLCNSSQFLIRDRNFLTHTDVSDKKKKAGIIINKKYSYRLKLSMPYEKSTAET